MASCFLVFACLQAMCLQYIYANCIPGTNCAASASQVTVTDTCMQNPYFVNQPGFIAQPYLGNVGFSAVSPCDVGCVNYALPAVQGTTVIQDGSIANNLANALQLLIVSNLLGNTLPCNDIALGLPVAQPGFQIAQPAFGCGRGFGCGCGCGGTNYCF